MNSRNSVLTAQNSLLYRPTVPPYCTALLAQNAPSKSLGPPLLDVRSDPPPLTVSQFAQQRQAGAMVLDCRSPEVFASPIPSAINVGLGSSFTTWAGSVLLRDVPLVFGAGAIARLVDSLLAATPHRLRLAKRLAFRRHEGMAHSSERHYTNAAVGYSRFKATTSTR